MRLRNDKNAEKTLEDYEYTVKNFPFTLKNDDTLEIGAGKGEMITEMAHLNPDKRFIAFEKFATVAAKIVKKAKNLNLKNLFVICQDAQSIDELFVGECDTIWLTFSDPWPKARHEKRRLTYKTFLNSYAKILSKDGVLKFKTDNDKLFEYSIESLEENKWNITFLTIDLHNNEKNSDNIMTGYEIKWSSIGKNINYLEAKKPC
ncbi:tRNA (guanosine(46)-N7)-methyltransferase TrmB [Mycoplasmopsis pullorum]|uniref:tRNA (guanosine(46)-N7)-methyltransferase TrmB n=1 Tax=Mycoplasmopsis pullorum TaxID=48003 RepID=UPI00111B6A4D|nr:tRNA (guanosine(46)-N7)-methyltransferase TrmB [Mycoplasmopsis pullorum]TNK82237.1 tRNA (guanosine(46)-N7)-methyltransferase TrmB [Mycoplasmopsis pullorum]TNK83367.1 tRNA (guanosine(46)-N7)-methyltransferase TrmB [Mycoplasmopsis pullorum]TNK84769.1 tRNA (guanosine(46)-N7)-methyltransferase TrmB [Mycoplasmopsis pullorum]TNK85826.1 tRNA (guanosine(46)-N7)-methyltransferase TrmB [Mycoplasmopsis pullorum]TNK86372.1 tRNA (guanosine(46)-N7)-methyltransferase TrmB [Mycoplasmopsis pullorum]